MVIDLLILIHYPKVSNLMTPSLKVAITFDGCQQTLKVIQPSTPKSNNPPKQTNKQTNSQPLTCLSGWKSIRAW